MGLISLSDVGGYVAWPADMLALSIVATLCGILLALAEETAVLLLVLASVVSVLLFGGYWAYTSWVLLGDQFPILEHLLSDLVLLYILQRSFLLVASSFTFGLFGVIVVELNQPKLLHR